MITEIKKYKTFDDSLFDTEAEAIEYEQNKKIAVEEAKLNEEFVQLLPYQHKDDTDKSEYCVLTGVLCNTYKVEQDHHKGDDYRGDLVKHHATSYHIQGRCISAYVADKFIAGLKRLIQKLNE